MGLCQICKKKLRAGEVQEGGNEQLRWQKGGREVSERTLALEEILT